jgi:hypothetical protein
MALYSIGDITVTKDTYGRAYTAAGGDVYADSTNNHIYSTWTVAFTGACSGNANGVASNLCPTSLGDEPLLHINNQNIAFLDSPLTHQDAPYVTTQRRY